MKNNSLVPGLKKKFECSKVEEISGWRKGPYANNPDLHLSTKFPALLKSRSDYHKHLIYPHWTLNPINSDSLKHSNSKHRLEVFQLKGKEEILDYEKRSEYERVQGKNIMIGSLTTRNPSVPIAPFTFLVNKPGKNLEVKIVKPDSKLQWNKKVLNNIQVSLAENETKESSQCQNNEENLYVKNEILTDVQSNSISRTGSAIVFGNKKTLFDLYSSALRSGSVKTKKDVQKLIKDTLDKGVLVKESQKSKLFMRKNEESQNFESVDSSFSSISPKCEPVFRNSNGRKDSLACKSEIEHSSVYSKNSKGESLSTNVTGSVKISQQSVRKQEKYYGSQEKVGKSENKFKDKGKNLKNEQKLGQFEIDKRVKKTIKDLKESGVKVRDLAMIEIIDSDEDLIDKRSKSVMNFYENRSIAGSSSQGIRSKPKPPSPQKSGTIVFQKIPDPILVQVPTKLEENLQKTPEKQKSNSKLKKNQGKNPKKSLTKQAKNLQPEPKPLKISTQSQNLLAKIPIILEEPLPKEKIAERILEEYKNVPKNMRRNSVSLDVIHENPKNIEKKSLNSKDLPKLKLNRRSSIETQKKKEEVSPQAYRRSWEQKPEESDFLLKKRYSVASPRFSFTSRETFPKDQKSLNKDSKDLKQQVKDNKDIKQSTKENSDQKEENSKILVKKPTFGEKSYRSSASYRTEDFNDKSWSRSSSFKKNLVFVIPPKAKKIKKVKKRNSDSSQEISDYEENIENSHVFDVARSNRKKKSLIYEINLLDKKRETNEMLEDNENEKDKEKSVLVQEPNFTESETDDSLFDLSELMQNKNFSMNKFAFSPQVCFRFSQRIDRNTYLNVNDIEINEYNLDHENFENFINKKRFVNGVNTVMGLYRSTNKHLEILDVDKFLPVQIHRKKLKEFEKMREKDQILQTRGKIVEISKKQKFSFSGLECERLNKLPKIERESKEITDEDIIKSGGSLTVRNKDHLDERLYCRVKNVYNLETISGMNSNSVDRIIKSLKASIKTLEKSSQKNQN